MLACTRYKRNLTTSVYVCITCMTCMTCMTIRPPQDTARPKGTA